MRSAVDPDHRPDGIIVIDVTRRLPAPRRTINPRRSVHDPDDRIIVVKEPRSRNILEPQAAVSALSRTALPEEQEAFPVLDSAGSVDLDRIQPYCPESVHKHHGVVDAENFICRGHQRPFKLAY